MKKLLAMVLMSLATTVVSAQTFPSKPVKIITSLPVGSGPDNITRKVAEKLSAKWGVPVLIENKPGGAGAVVFGAYADVAADGYTLLSGDAGNFVGYPILYDKPNALANVEPLVGQNMANLMLVTAPDIKNIADLKTQLNKHAVYASGGVGSPMHLEGAELASFFKMDVNHVPYKDYGAMWVDTSNGLIAYTFATIGSTSQLEVAGKLKYLAFAGNARHPEYPNVPTVNELTGQNKKHLRGWVVYYLKKGVPTNVKSKLATDIADVVKSSEVQEMIKTLGYVTPPTTPEGLTNFVNSESVEYNKLVKKYNISIK